MRPRLALLALGLDLQVTGHLTGPLTLTLRTHLSFLLTSLLTHKKTQILLFGKQYLADAYISEHLIVNFSDTEVMN